MPGAAPEASIEYENCKLVRWLGPHAPEVDLASARREALVWPPRCGNVSGWAGIGIELSTHATGFSADGKKFVVCGPAPECQTVDLASGAVIARVTPDWPNDEMSGAPVRSTPVVAKLFKDLGAPAKPGRFPYPDELRVSWAVDAAGSTLVVTLLDLQSGEEESIQHFPMHSASSDQPIVLEGVSVSPKGDVLELDTFTGQGGSGYEVALVNLHAAAARLFERIAASSPPDPKKWLDKAAAAEKKARSVAQRFAN